MGNRAFKNYESGAYGYIDFAKALEVSCNTFFYRVGYDFWRRLGSDVADVNAKDPLVSEAKAFGFGAETGIDLPGEASGRIADRRWKRAYYEAQKDYYCKVARKASERASGTTSYAELFAREFCAEGYAYRAGDAVNFAIGQGDTVVTPLQLARGYAAISNGGTLYAPRIGKAVVDADGTVLKEIEPKVERRVQVPKRTLAYIDRALQGVTREGTMAWRMTGFPLDKVTIRSKTGSAEVYGKQSTSWVASYSKDYVVVMMVSQGGTGSGTSGPAIRKIWEGLYGVNGEQVASDRTLIPNVVAPDGLPTFQRDGSILPPVGGGPVSHAHEVTWTGGCWSPSWGSRLLGTLLVWSATAHRGELTGGDPTAYLSRHLVNVAIGLILLFAVAVVEHRWVRILTPMVYVGAVVGLCAVLAVGTTVNGSRSWLIIGGWSVQPSEFAKVAVVVGSALWIAERGRNRWRSLGADRPARAAADRWRAGCPDHLAAGSRDGAGARGHDVRSAGRRWGFAAVAGRTGRGDGAGRGGGGVARRTP